VGFGLKLYQSSLYDFEYLSSPASACILLNRQIEDGRDTEWQYTPNIQTPPMARPAQQKRAAIQNYAKLQAALADLRQQSCYRPQFDIDIEPEPTHPYPYPSHLILEV
jgi:hypothetical protein